MALKAEFEVANDKITFTTQTNGDKLKIQGVHLSAEDAGQLAQMINSGLVLLVTIKEKAK